MAISSFLTPGNVISTAAIFSCLLSEPYPHSHHLWLVSSWTPFSIAAIPSYLIPGPHPHLRYLAKLQGSQLFTPTVSPRQLPHAPPIEQYRQDGIFSLAHWHGSPVLRTQWACQNISSFSTVPSQRTRHCSLLPQQLRPLRGSLPPPASLVLRQNTSGPISQP